MKHEAEARALHGRSVCSSNPLRGGSVKGIALSTGVKHCPVKRSLAGGAGQGSDNVCGTSAALTAVARSWPSNSRAKISMEPEVQIQ